MPQFLHHNNTAQLGGHWGAQWRTSICSNKEATSAQP